MNRKISTAVIGAVALVGGVFVGGSPAYAATTPTLVLVITERSTNFGMGPSDITATASIAGGVKFSAAGLVIKGCEAVATTTVSPFVAKCSWLPAAAVPTILTGTLTPTDAVNFTTVNSAPVTVKVGAPVQGVVPSIHIYVDTVLGSGAVGPLASRTGVTCAITSEYMVGHQIVFRVYASNADQGGVGMDPSNTAKAYIEVAGLKDPIQMSYANRAGNAFWTGAFRTGTAPGLYNKLGIINYKVTMVAKDTSTVKVLSTKRVLVRDAAGALVLNEAGNLTFKWISFYRTRQLTNPIVGATGIWDTASRFPATSQLTLFAAPATP